MYQVRETSMTIAVRLRATVDERVRACQRCFRLFGRIISEDVTGRRVGRGEGGKKSDRIRAFFLELLFAC